MQPSPLSVTRAHDQPAVPGLPSWTRRKRLQTSADNNKGRLQKRNTGSITGHRANKFGHSFECRLRAGPINESLAFAAAADQVRTLLRCESLPKAVVRKQDARRLKIRRKRLLSLQSAMAAVSRNADGIWRFSGRHGLADPVGGFQNIKRSIHPSVCRRIMAL